MVIDLNADLGEGFGIWRLGDDTALLDIVTSANVACGFHAGDPVTIRRTCAAAIDRGVTIGAQVSYRDLAHFGRREMEVEPEELCAEVLYQLAAVDGIARAMGGRVSYVKPHGALYNRVVRDPVQAAALIDAVADYDASLPVLTLPGSAVHQAATAEGVPTVCEAFADRAYTAEGTLVPRREPGSVLHTAEEVAARAVRMAVEQRVRAADGSDVAVPARSICVHGDTPDAVGLARAVRDRLLEAGVVLQPFT
ncbi:LamB/YcsF family protein [Nonomuraea sp. NPDC050328]|uniref:LamB/YcsF family protein n=1 Tax=Nonomuraea sp. NPDC050328 TaxID=3364361 RepID=UPI003792C252